MSRTKRAVATATAAVALVVAGTAGPAAAATPGPNRTFIGFVAPAAGQAVQLGVEHGTIHYCFRWPGGVNTGRPADVDTGLEAWNPYLGVWANDAAKLMSEYIRTTDLTAQLFAGASNTGGSGFACEGKPISEVKQLPARPQVDTYYVDFR